MQDTGKKITHTSNSFSTSENSGNISTNTDTDTDTDKITVANSTFGSGAPLLEDDIWGDSFDRDYFAQLPPPQTKPKKAMRTPKKENPFAKVFTPEWNKRCDDFISKLSRIFARLFLGSLVYFIIAILFPEVREAVPSFYAIVDGILWCYNKFFEFIVSIIERVIALF